MSPLCNPDDMHADTSGALPEQASEQVGSQGYYELHYATGIVQECCEY